MISSDLSISSESDEEEPTLPNPQAEIVEDKSLKNLQQVLMKNWSIEEFDMANTESVVQYHAYLDGIEKFVKRQVQIPTLQIR